MSEPVSEIRHSVFIRAPRAKVWAALTTAQAMDAWWGTRGSEIDLRPGGKLTLRWRGWGPERDINAAPASAMWSRCFPPSASSFGGAKRLTR
jgi:uncharacterized protein YndB with AHSA1/START domain